MIESFRELIDDELDQLMPTSSSHFRSLYEGGRYLLFAPCKRIRPLLTLASTEMLQKQALLTALRPACALEMVHTYSLIHDDLPCMDNDTFRRGLPTLHRVYNEGHAVLVGDYLLTYAFEVLTMDQKLNDTQKVALVRSLSRAAGSEGMVGGQVMDLENIPLMEELHLRKTGALFRAALEFGGICAQCTPTLFQQLQTFGMQFGQLFQIVDDILDEDHQLSKEKMHALMNNLYQEILETLESLPGNKSLLSQLITLVVDQIKAASCQR